MPRPPNNKTQFKINRVVGTKDALRIAYNALKATGKLPGPLGTAGKVAQIAETVNKLYKATKITPPKSGPVTTLKGKNIPKEVLQNIKKAKVPSYSKPVSKGTQIKVSRALKKTKENIKNSQAGSNVMQVSKEKQISMIVPKHLRGKPFNYKKDL